MITLNDYLYSGDTIFRILQQYTEDRISEKRQEKVTMRLTWHTAIF